MNERVFYLKALGLIVIGSIVKVAVKSISNSISAPSTIVNNTYVQPVVVDGDGDVDNSGASEIADTNGA